VIPPRYIDEIKSDKRLDFHAFVAKEFFSTYPGFDAFSTSVNQTIFQDAVRTQLTQALALTIEPIARETPNTLNLVYGDAPGKPRFFNVIIDNLDKSGNSNNKQIGKKQF
jgi:hypothetical protein